MCSLRAVTVTTAARHLHRVYSLERRRGRGVKSHPGTKPGGGRSEDGQGYNAEPAAGLPGGKRRGRREPEGGERKEPWRPPVAPEARERRRGKEERVRRSLASRRQDQTWRIQPSFS
jgi:hypothetical protein